MVERRRYRRLQQPPLRARRRVSGIACPPSLSLTAPSCGYPRLLLPALTTLNRSCCPLPRAAYAHGSCLPTSSLHALYTLALSRKSLAWRCLDVVSPHIT